MFTCRTVFGKTPLGTRLRVEQDNKSVHCFVRSDGLGAIFVTDEDYESRVAFMYLTKLITQYDTELRQTWLDIDSDASIPYPQLRQDLLDYQDPAKVDNIVKIQQDLDETMVVLVSCFID